ncbi:unnamed protein product, partial [Choristocarpus tenellus]
MICRLLILVVSFSLPSYAFVGVARTLSWRTDLPPQWVGQCCSRDGVVDVFRITRGQQYGKESFEDGLRRVGTTSMAAAEVDGDSLSVEGGTPRPNLLEMRKEIEMKLGTDPKLVMEYVQELRARKSLLLSSLKENSGVVSPAIDAVLEELCLLNPSRGAGTSSKDGGVGHYNALLQGYWKGVSTLIPGIPCAPPAPDPDASIEDEWGTLDGKPCTLGSLVDALGGTGLGAGLEGIGLDPAMPVRPRPLTLHCLSKEGNSMPRFAIAAGYAHADAGLADDVGNGVITFRGEFLAMGNNRLRWKGDRLEVNGVALGVPAGVG